MSPSAAVASQPGPGDDVENPAADDSIGGVPLAIARLAAKSCAEQAEWAVPDRCEGLTAMADVASANPQHRCVASFLCVLLLFVGALCLTTGIITTPLASANSKLLASSDSLLAENAKLHAMLKGYKERARLLQTEVVAIGSKHASVAAKLEKETTAHALSRESSAQEMKVLKGQHDALVTDQAALKKSIQQLLNVGGIVAARSAP